MNIYLDLETTYRLVALLAACGIAVTTTEFLVNWREYREDGMYSWSIARERRVLIAHPRLSRTVELFLDVPGFWCVLALRLIAALTVVAAVAIFGTLPPAAVVLLLVTTLAVAFRHSYGMDGSDQMSSILVIALTLYCLSPTNRIVALAAIWFVALQSCLSYFASGVAKVVSQKWRSGTAVFEVLNTASYGRRDVARLLGDAPRIARLLNWSVVVFECAFPLALIAGGRVALVFFAGGLLLHVGIALCMGLNSFLWAFVATYPAVLYAGTSIR